MRKSCQLGAHIDGNDPLFLNKKRQDLLLSRIAHRGDAIYPLVLIFTDLAISEQHPQAIYLRLIYFFTHDEIAATVLGSRSTWRVCHG